MQREGYILSGFLHIAVILLMWLGLPYFFQTQLVPPPPISVDLISSDELELMAQAPTQVEEVKPTPPKPVEPLKPEPKPEPKKVTEAPTQQSVETIEDLVAVEQDILSLLDDDVIEELKKPEPKEQPKPKEPPKPKPQKVAEKKPEKKKDDKSFDSLLKNVTDKKTDVRPVSHTPGNNPDAEEDISKILSASELSALRQQVASCWNIPAGARDAADLVVDVHVELDGQGQVTVAQVTGGNRNHPYFQSASESAARAVKNPRCNPLKIPPQRIAQMQSFTFRFNPQFMF